MTISSNLRKAGPFAGNAATTAFPFAYKVFATSDVVVTKSDGVTETTLTLTTDYTVALNADQNANPGGTVTYPASGSPLPVGQTLTLSSSVPELQQTSITNQGGFYPKIIEDALDRLTIFVQQFREILGRSLCFPVSDPTLNITLPTAAQRANKVLGFDGNGGVSTYSAASAVTNAGSVNYVPVSGPTAGISVTVQTWLDRLLTAGASLGAALVGYLQAGVGAISRTVQNKLRERVSVNDFGAVGDGVTDDYAAFALALASGAKTVLMPDPSSFYRLSAGIVVPDGVTLSGSSMQPANQGGTPKGTVLKFDNSVATCVTLGTANNTTANIETCVIWRAGTPPAGSTGIFCDRINNPQLKNVAVVNHARLYSFFASGSAGIAAAMKNCYGSDCTENYFYIDGWPELRVTGGRFGRIGTEASGNAFLYITATGAAGVGMGPNTICFDNVQFNQGSAGPAYWLHFDAVNIAQGNQAIYQFVNCHIEGISTAYVKTTATAPYLAKLAIDTCVFNSTAPNFFAIDTATQINECRIVSSLIGGPMTLASIALINRFIISSSEVGGAASFTGKALAQNNMKITSTFFNSTLTLAGTWASLEVSAEVNGAVTNNAVQFNSASNIDLRLPGVFYSNYQIIDRVSYTGQGPQHYSRTARGSSSAPTVSLAGDTCGHFRGWLYDGAQFGQCAVIRFGNSGAAPSAGSTPGAFIISTTPVGAVTATDRWGVGADGYFSPVADNAYQIGSSGARASSVWAANGTIQTSDARTKKDITYSALGLDFINALRPVSYKWIEGSKRVIRQEVNEDGSPGEIITESVPGTRTHWGLIAQEVKAVCDAAGVDFGGWVLTDKDNPDSQQALRYDQFISPLIKAVQELNARVVALESQTPA